MHSYFFSSPSVGLMLCFVIGTLGMIAFDRKLTRVRLA